MAKWAFIASAFFLALVPVQVARAYQFKDVYEFCQQELCADGRNAVSGVVLDAAGNVYGATQYGGDTTFTASGHGVIYELIPNAKHTAWKYKQLYRFCKKANCADGAEPLGTLIIDTAGNLYGTTRYAGAEKTGNVFELSPNAKHTRWRLRVLHQFCPNGTAGCTDGQLPETALTYQGAASGVPYDGQSPLYGTTVQGGAYINTERGVGNGTAFELSPLSGTRWKEKVIYNFCPDASCGTVLGRPSSALMPDASGNLYGTAAGAAGDLFKLSPNAHRTKWTETTLHHFCSWTNCTDGDLPFAENLFEDAAGAIYGTTVEGGNPPDTAIGVIYKLVPNGTNSTYSVLYNFCSLANCADGAEPIAGVIMDASGNLLGTTGAGGDNGSGGTVFSYGSGSMHVLHTFCTPGCGDGEQPSAGLTIAPSGLAYGTTTTNVFALVP
ncbi:MAG TPA: choice-of-anchor tandem repeat GloVer-containing protein [Rhizomicrobium sp.]|nr:choice-of-anchor tandem repeat GloVer-containing protein [Rhizomicrobium sp.]